MNRWRLARTIVPAAALGALGCDPLTPEVFVAAAWNDDLACLERGGAVDVYDQDEPVTCEDDPKCWRSPDDVIFVGTGCEAPEGWGRVSADDDDRCQDALSAWDRGEDGRCEE